MTQNWLDDWLRRAAVIGAVVALSAPMAPQVAEASQWSRQSYRQGMSYGTAARSYARVIEGGTYAAQRRYVGRYQAVRYGFPGGRLQCVPFARENSGIELTGNAHTWWNSAEGVYERGARPEVGSVLSFRSTGRMRLGHVAVVSNVIDSRTLGIDHANWSGPGAGYGGITRNMTVVDVSEANDWSAVRASLGDGQFGSVYPTDGFIYDRPDRGTMVANNQPSLARSPAPVLNAAPHDFRSPAERVLVTLGNTVEEEVAEAPDDRAPRVRRASTSRYTTVYRPTMPIREAAPRGRGASVTMVSLRTRAPVAAPARISQRAVAAPSHSRRDATPASAKRGKSRT